MGGEMYVYGAIIVGLLALVFAYTKLAAISKMDAGNARMKEIAGHIYDGSGFS